MAGTRAGGSALALSVVAGVVLSCAAAVLVASNLGPQTELAEPDRPKVAARHVLVNNPVARLPRVPSTIDDTLDWQAQALLAGDEAAWLAPVHPDRADVVQAYRNQFRILRLLGVVDFQPLVQQPDLAVADPVTGTVTVRVFFGFCVQTSDCLRLDKSPPGGRTENEGFTFDLTWSRVEPHRRYVITGSVLIPEREVDGLRDRFPPWLTDELVFRTGAKVVVAAPPSLATELDRVVAVADQAAVAVARFVRWTVPTKYVIYLAGPGEWGRWYGPEEFGDIDGFVARVARTAAPIVLRYNTIDRDRLGVAFRHEMGHVNTLLGTMAGAGIPEAFIEGMAEYVAHDGRSIAAYERIYEVRQFLRTGWNGDLDALSARTDDVLRRGATYSIGFLLWRCIADRYGEPAMFNFFTSAVRESLPPEVAAADVFPHPWTDVKEACVQFILDRA